jgi:hypothetical protein
MVDDKGKGHAFGAGATEEDIKFDVLHVLDDGAEEGNSGMDIE